MAESQSRSMAPQRHEDDEKRIPNSKLGVSFVVGFIAVVVTGYFVGLQAPMTQSENASTTTSEGVASSSTSPNLGSKNGGAGGPIESIEYQNLATAYSGPTTQWENKFSNLSRVPYDPVELIVIHADAKRLALDQRSELRAFNGAPPTIPHKIEQMSTASCMVCHSEGFVSPTVRAPAMSHEFYANCTQCHVEQNSAEFASVEFQPNSFVGLPAPESGPRAFPGAPPLIPHSTWMRENCLSCHGFTGHEGLKTTHAWRQNCTQCHGSSSVLEQAPPAINRFLPPPSIRARDDAGE